MAAADRKQYPLAHSSLAAITHPSQTTKPTPGAEAIGAVANLRGELPSILLGLNGSQVKPVMKASRDPRITSSQRIALAFHLIFNFPHSYYPNFKSDGSTLEPD
jgi:hypothetical protein